MDASNMKTKKTKLSRNLLILMLLGDGTVQNNNVFKMCHCALQEQYLAWKCKLLNEHAIRNNGVKSYECKCGYKVGSIVYYTQLNIIPFTKLLRRVFYQPKKNILNRRMLNRIDLLGLLIWYMDDGGISYRKTDGKCHGFYVKISTCTSLEDTQVLIDYFKEEWGILFYRFKEGPGYSLCCGTKEGIKFINIVLPYVEQVECMKYKVSYDLSQRSDSLCSLKRGEMGNSTKKEKILSILRGNMQQYTVVCTGTNLRFVLNVNKRMSTRTS